MTYIKPIKGPKGKIVTAYAVINADTDEEIARYRIRHEGHGYWRHALNLARAAAETAQ